MKLDYEPVSTTEKPSVWPSLLLIGIAFFATFVVSLFYSFFVSTLPRASRGESVLVPWSVCWAGSLIVPVALPFLIALLFVRSATLRLVFLVALIASLLTWHTLFGADDLLSKAWRRGL